MADADSISDALWRLSDLVLEARSLLDAFSALHADTSPKPPLRDPHSWVFPLSRLVDRLEVAVADVEENLRVSKQTAGVSP